MARKLGETLVAKGILTRQQLDQALRIQVMRGGHLGTCLTELGFTDERALGKVLSELLGIPQATREMLARIPPKVLEALPREEAVRRQVIPVSLERKLLHLAVIEPKHAQDLTALKYRVALHVAPETRILEALERYYGVPRRKRFIVPASTVSEPNTPSAFVGAAERHDPATGRRQQVVPAVSSSAKWLHTLARRMSRVASHSELGDLLLDQALGGCMRRILFAVDGGVAEVANARGLTLGAIKGLRFPIDERSIFALASEDSYYRGPLPVEFDRGTFYSRLGLPAPSEVLVLPIYGEERLEAALYGDGGPTGRISHPDESYLPLIGLTGLAVRMLSFRTQLCPS